MKSAAEVFPQLKYISLTRIGFARDSIKVILATHQAIDKIAYLLTNNENLKKKGYTSHQLTELAQKIENFENFKMFFYYADVIDDHTPSELIEILNRQDGFSILKVLAKETLDAMLTPKKQRTRSAPKTKKRRTVMPYNENKPAEEKNETVNEYDSKLISMGYTQDAVRLLTHTEDIKKRTQWLIETPLHNLLLSWGMNRDRIVVTTVNAEPFKNLLHGLKAAGKLVDKGFPLADLPMACGFGQNVSVLELLNVAVKQFEVWGFSPEMIKKIIQVEHGALFNLIAVYQLAMPMMGVGFNFSEITAIAAGDGGFSRLTTAALEYSAWYRSGMNKGSFVTMVLSSPLIPYHSSWDIPNEWLKKQIITARDCLTAPVFFNKTKSRDIIAEPRKPIDLTSDEEGVESVEDGSASDEQEVTFSPHS